MEIKSADLATLSWRNYPSELPEGLWDTLGMTRMKSGLKPCLRPEALGGAHEAPTSCPLLSGVKRAAPGDEG